MITRRFSDIMRQELVQGAIYNDLFPGFREDYGVLHCLLRLYKPSRFLEIGTCIGTGTKIICNAIPESTVYSLDLPKELAHTSLQYPTGGKDDSVGHTCDLPYIQLRGDSLTFDYTSIYPINGWWIDSAHDFEHPYHETLEAVKSQANIIIWHDSDIVPVWEAINKGLDDNYILTRVEDTRISYAVRK